MDAKQYDYVRSELTKLVNMKLVNDGKEFQLDDFSFLDNKFTLRTSNEQLSGEYSISDAIIFIKGTKLLNQSTYLPAANNIKSIQANAGDHISNKIKNIVLETIDKLREDKSYIPQANAINGQIQVLLNLKKLELDSRKLYASLNNKL